MPAISRNLIFCLFAFTLSGCITNVDFSDGRAVSKPPYQTVQVFMDKTGDIYPDTVSGAGPGVIDNTDRTVMCEHEPKLCNRWYSTIKDDPSLNNLYTQWRQSQSEAINRLAEEVVTALQTQQNQTVVMMIHGFRVEDASADYSSMKEALMKGRDAASAPVFMEIHWDGRKSPSPRALGAWLDAQWTAPTVGYRLRPLLNSIQDKAIEKGLDPDLFVLTHSTGAVVAGALFGDSSSALPECMANEDVASRCGPAYYEYYLNRRVKWPKKKSGVPQWEGMDLVMLAAATPPNTFAPARDSNGGFLGSNTTTIALSHNRWDGPLIKYFRVPWLGGYSGLGADRNGLKDVVDRLGSPASPRADVFIMEMSKDVGFWKHDAKLYLEAERFSDAVDLLWDDTDR